MPIYNSKDKQIVALTYNGILFGNKEELIVNIYNTNTHQNNYAVSMRPDQKRTYYMIPFI